MSHRGHSLIELIAALAIAGALGSYALFWAGSWVAGKDADATVAAFASAIHLARQSAIVGNVGVTFCPGTGAACGPRNAWHEGVLVFTDFNRNREIDGRDHLIRAIPPLRADTRVYWRSFRNRSHLRFTARGITDWQNGHFLFCASPTRPELARQLVLNAAGRLYASRDRDGDGVHEDVRGRALACP